MQSWGYSLESLWLVLFIKKLIANYLENKDILDTNYLKESLSWNKWQL